MGRSAVCKAFAGWWFVARCVRGASSTVMRSAMWLTICFLVIKPDAGRQDDVTEHGGVWMGSSFVGVRGDGLCLEMTWCSRSARIAWA